MPAARPAADVPPRPESRAGRRVLLHQGGGRQGPESAEHVCARQHHHPGRVCAGERRTALPGAGLDQRRSVVAERSVRVLGPASRAGCSGLAGSQSTEQQQPVLQPHAGQQSVEPRVVGHGGGGQHHVGVHLGRRLD